MELKKCHFKDINLIRVVPKNTLPTIAQKGFIPRKSKLTAEAYVRRMERELSEFTAEAWLEILESKANLDNLVFAAKKEDLDAVISMLVSPNHPDPLESLAVLGINPDCDGLFHSEAIGSDKDMIAKSNIKPECICEIIDWEDHIDKSFLLQLIKAKLQMW